MTDRPARLPDAKIAATVEQVRVARAYGTWASPLTARRAAAGSRRFGALQANARWIVWTEGRPEEQGRQAIVAARVTPQGAAEPVNVLPVPYSARSRVHEYGGGEILLDGDTVFFVNASDQGIYRLELGGTSAVTQICAAPGWRFADMDRRGKWLVAVAERHETATPHHPENMIVRVDLDGALPVKAPEVMLSGCDFYASPRLCPDGTALAYLAWSLPDMPWDSAAACIVSVDRALKLTGPVRALQGRDGAAFYGLRWRADGALFAVSDATGWGQVVCWLTPDAEPVAVFPTRAAEFGKPLWNLATRTFALLDEGGREDGSLLALGLEGGRPIALTRGSGGDIRCLVLPIEIVRVDEPATIDHRLVAFVSEVDRPSSVAILTPLPDGTLAVARVASGTEPEARDQVWVAVGQPEVLRRADGIGVPVVIYPPTSPTHEGLTGTAPPTLVFAHGGPTSAASRALSLRVQFYTSRGFQVVDVDYAGSVGYGRAYRARLDGQWGIADVEDCVAVADALKASGRADPQRIAIAGGSAGGYTVLMALATTTAFNAGSCHYGISDLVLLDQHTHKFESGYQRRLVGGATPEDYAQRLVARSPLNLVNGISAPVIFFQGLDDKVVPPEQTLMMLASLQKRGLAAFAHEFAGEGHGFRRAETIEAVLDAELAFFKSALVLGGA